ncbi:hypothetical protein HW130_14650 [Streptomyces sp. PKU-EA00015]|uniref:hypothetical protein n=1 Tax=Streptomyces sp. PKU-EA00015 TaxID=2748326 RepID=UPI0015A3F62C|nr:hypothetical protein [Streptomyces sp. PKU-EA00015]NWF27488.1 hypothetical protein [Streptomyces sp. PKU-EA00015]
MHSETAYEITTIPLQPSPTHGAMLPHEIPPGVQLVTLPGGIRTLAYTQPPAVPAPQPIPVAAPIPTWAKTTALLTPTIGGGVAAAGIGLSYAAPGLIAMSQALWAAVALIAAGAIALPLLLGIGRRSTGRAAPARITQNITATGLFGKATGTINHH